MIQKIKNHIPFDCFTHAELKTIFPGSSDKRYSLIKRAFRKEELIPLRRGLYCLEKKIRRKPLELFAIAQRMYSLSAVSLESALSFHGLIPEAVPVITSISIKRSREFSTSIGQFIYHHVPEKKFLTKIQLYAVDNDHLFIADPLRAICDYIHVYRKDWKGIGPLKASLRIEEENLLLFKKDEFDELQNYYQNRRLDRFLKFLKKDLCL